MDNLVERLFSYAGYGLGERCLENMQRIDEWQGYPHRQFDSIHIAGTNGKGSVALKIAIALQETGLRVGLYTSPHILTFRERIQINGCLIAEDFIMEFLPRIFSFIDKEKMQPTFFELLTALGFAYFAHEKIDIAVIETGLGGRFDATNIINPVLSVITSIEMEHTEILGSTLEKIAFAKAGIIKNGVPVVVGPRARFAPILDAERLILAPTVTGFYDCENSAIARSALELLGIEDAAIAVGLRRCPPCRFEIIDPRPIILDVAHNPDGFAHLAAALEEMFPGKRFHVVLAMGKKKDVMGCVQHLAKIALSIACVSNDNLRLLTAEELRKSLQSDAAYCAFSLEEALQTKEPILVCGSFYIMADARKILMAQQQFLARRRKHSLPGHGRWCEDLYRTALDIFDRSRLL